ncbi:TetR/AcrR family transcriptional regulator [Natronosporangium hydrolyticum]|uniref:TetR/AcrR family transcriptional regulator n=1 Tax=Natronosporangium hydrolyticum TaxID=2811111 RepID=A0A895YGA5_9ACTN|nr:TetR/AcrR family transcriptional regulator [Natronosporangium hydrolyticum]QSB13220.1 TetR/AcrR family transcriptional regulator [Natronosporangium hydrolyticum]
MKQRLAREDRRAQLLDVAYDLVRDEGTDALTLARLAERAAVSKPVAYDHFGTRPGLLAALYRHHEERQNQQLRRALADAGDSLPAASRIVAAGYVDCLLATGPEFEEVSAALLAYEETKDYLQESRDYFVEEYRQIFTPFVALDGAAGDAVLTGLVGSAEALARAAHHGALTRDQAIDALAGIILAALGPLAHHGDHSG